MTIRDAQGKVIQYLSVQDVTEIRVLANYSISRDTMSAYVRELFLGRVSKYWIQVSRKGVDYRFSLVQPSSYMGARLESIINLWREREVSVVILDA